MLLISLEHAGSDLVNALAAAARGAGVEDCDLQVQTVRDLVDLDSPDDIDAVDRLASEAQARVIVIDSFRRSTRTDENRAEDVSLYWRTLQRLTRNGERLVIVIHHLTKNGDLPRGSMDFVAAAGSWIRLTRKKDIVKLEATHHGAAPISLSLVVIRDEDKLTLEVPAAGVAGTSAGASAKVKSEVLRVIENKPGMGLRAIREAVRSTTAVAHTAIDEAVDALEAEERIRNAGTATKHAWEIRT